MQECCSDLDGMKGTINGFIACDSHVSCAVLTHEYAGLTQEHAGPTQEYAGLK